MNETYECISPVAIRREPRIIEYKLGKNFITNRVGELNLGTQREVFSTLTDKTNVTWGRISAPDATGNAQWVCLSDINRVFMQKVERIEPVNSLEQRLTRLEDWAATKGY